MGIMKEKKKRNNKTLGAGTVIKKLNGGKEK